MVAAAQNAVPRHFCNIYNALLVHGIHPTSWKNAKCILIFKLGEKKKDRAESNCPISLLSCRSKTVEKVVARRTALYAEKSVPHEIPKEKAEWEGQCKMPSSDY